MMMMRITIAAFIFVMVASQNNEVQVVEQLLDQLRRSTMEKLVDFDKQWTNTFETKKSTVSGFEQAHREQSTECSRRQSSVEAHMAEIWRTTEFISWIGDRVKVNDARIVQLKQLLCDQAKNAVDGLRNRKIMQTIATLTKENVKKMYVENKQDNEGERQKTMGSMFDLVLEVMKNPDRILKYELDVETQLDQEITNLIDSSSLSYSYTNANTHSQQQQNEQYMKNPFYMLLDDLSNSVGLNMKEQQENMIGSGLSFVDYHVQIVSENDFMQSHRKEQQERLRGQQDQLILLKRGVEQCRIRLQELDNSVGLANQELQSSVRNRLRMRNSLIEELQLFQQLYELYLSDVSGSQDGFEQLISEYVVEVDQVVQQEEVVDVQELATTDVLATADVEVSDELGLSFIRRRE